jgi:hypothetical protein
VPVAPVDNFRGQEAPVVSYSMASSSAEDVPRALDFYFSRKRLNVPISRAHCLAYVVASPAPPGRELPYRRTMHLANPPCVLVAVTCVSPSGNDGREESH